MKNKIIIDKFGIGYAVAIKKNKKLIDLFLDPPNTLDYYPRLSLVVAKIVRKVSLLGGYFIELPNGRQGLLKSKKSYNVNTFIKVQSKAFFECKKPQQFLETIKSEGIFSIISEGKGGVYFSKSIDNLQLKNEISDFIKKQVSFKPSKFDIIIRKRAEIVYFPSLVDGLNKEIERFQKLKDHQANAIGLLSYGNLAKSQALGSILDLDNYDITEEEGSFDTHGIWDDVYRLLNKKYDFGNGSYLYIEQTSAFCLIDVNSGNNMKLSAGKINLEACKEIIINIRTRGIGGKIVVDFISCSNRFKTDIFHLMKNLCEQETIPTKIWGWTRAGNFEIEREHFKTPVHLVLDN